MEVGPPPRVSTREGGWLLGGQQQQQWDNPPLRQSRNMDVMKGRISRPHPRRMLQTAYIVVFVIINVILETAHGHKRGVPLAFQPLRLQKDHGRQGGLNPLLDSIRRPLTGGLEIWRGSTAHARSSIALAAPKHVPLGAGLSVSLDKPVLHKRLARTAGKVPQLVWTAVGLALALLLVAKTPGWGLLNARVRDFCERRHWDVYERLVYRLRLLKGHLERLSAALRRRWLTLFPPEVDVLPSTAYPVPLTLQERSNIGGSFLRYKFAFPRPLHVMDLDLGQSVILIGNTPEDRVMRAAFVPSSAPGERGVLEVVAEKNNPEDPSVKILGTLAIGESIQATPGARLTNRHPGPINKLLIIVSKLGIVPALQFLNALLPSAGGYSVDFANVVWVNERQDQYILQNDLQDLFYRYNSKLDVYTVAERDLFMGDLAHNPQFRASIPPPSKETLVLVAGPEYFTAKVVDYLTKSGYAEDVIVAL